MVNEVAKLLNHCTYLLSQPLPPLLLPTAPANSSSTSSSASITKLARPFVLHEHITSLKCRDKAPRQLIALVKKVTRARNTF